MLKTSKQEREEKMENDKKDDVGAFIDAYEENKDRIFCPNCGKRYSSSVYKCPSCGKTNPKETFPVGSYYTNVLITTELLLIILGVLRGVEIAVIYMILAPIMMLLNVIFVYLSFVIGGAVKRATETATEKK